LRALGDAAAAGTELASVGTELAAVGTELAAVGTELAAVGTEFAAVAPRAAFQSSPAWPMTAMGWRTGTSSPSGWRILSNKPEAPAGTSKLALSVSTSQTVWSAWTAAPSAAFQRTMIHDSTVFPWRGMISV
jgi:hypothetical protein